MCECLKRNSFKEDEELAERWTVARQKMETEHPNDGYAVSIR